MEIQKPIRRRRYHREEFKQAVIAACCEPGASVAGIAMANGVNANQVRRWMRERGISASTQHSPVRTPIARAEQMASRLHSCADCTGAGGMACDPD